MRYYNQKKTKFPKAPVITLINFVIVNPVTGEEIGQPGQFFTPQREHAPPQPVSQDRLKNRIPPGGFSTPLW